MTNRERIVCALEGDTPDVTPLTSYEWMWRSDDAELAALVERGLGLTRHVGTCAADLLEVKHEEENWHEAGHNWRRLTVRTPAGSLQELYMDGWRQDFFIKAPQDYKVLEWMARHTTLRPSYDGYEQAEEALGGRGILIVSASRSPIQRILVDFVGIENFCYHLADDVQEMHSCYEALRESLYTEMEIIAAGPGRHVKMWENFTAEAFGPERFRRFHLPVYRRCGEILHASGKLLMAHMDGRLGRVADALRGSGLDALESLTPPAEGDVPPERWRSIWPDLRLWVNIPCSWYFEPPETFGRRIRDLVRSIGDRRGLLFEISEDLPANWRQSIPVALGALQGI